MTGKNKLQAIPGHSRKIKKGGRGSLKSPQDSYPEGPRDHFDHPNRHFAPQGCVADIYIYIYMALL